jgi:iron uptake system EfeUOB component EfeO/EfeM
MKNITKKKQIKEKTKIFISSCENGNIKKAKLLYSSYNINIHFNEESAFRFCCENGPYQYMCL